ncbi:MAG: cation-transporting P-type ATPase, partial [Dehalococcoidales bacterium]
MNQQWHLLRTDEALTAFNSKRSGLTETEAKSRLLQYGHNELQAKKKT